MRGKEFPKFIAGVRLHARAAAGRNTTGDIAWRDSQARLGARPAPEGQKNE